MKTDAQRSRVVRIAAGDVLRDGVVNEPIAAEMVSLAVRVLAGTTSTDAAWQRILGPARRIVLKFNRVGSDVLRTNDPLARVLLRSLEAAGYGRDVVGVVEALEVAGGSPATRRVTPGWGESIPVGAGQEQLANYLLEADAVINVPLLKTHRIAGMSGVMKNLAFATIRRPARYHDGQCSPYVAQVIAHQHVSSRLRLNMVNALRVVVRDGPDVNPADVVDLGAFLLGFDPVAVDTVGQEELLIKRRSLGLASAVDVPYLLAAEALGVGRRAPHLLERLTPSLGG